MEWGLEWGTYPMGGPEASGGEVELAPVASPFSIFWWLVELMWYYNLNHNFCCSMLPETIGQLFVGGMDQPFSCMKVVNVSFFLALILLLLAGHALRLVMWPHQSQLQLWTSLTFYVTSKLVTWFFIIFIISALLSIGIAEQSTYVIDHVVHPCLFAHRYCGKTADYIRMPFGVVSGVGLCMIVLDFGGDRRRGRGSLGWICGIPL